ncbi:MAG: hypothetical protein KAW41_02425 [Candidatus Diapherotrites archaeon]|nr:hypothetical protein [Candidatus Diapherotrites archaeon]
MKTVVFLPKKVFSEEQMGLIGPAEFCGEKVKDERDLIAKCRGAEAVLAVWSRTGPLTKRFFESLPELRFVSVYVTGYEWVDIGAAKEAGVKVSNCPDYCTKEVVDWTVTMMQRLAGKEGLEGKTLGVIGLGAIGKGVVSRGEGLGMRAIAWDRKEKKPYQVALEKLLGESDFVSIHLALNSETRGFIGEKEIALMKKGAFLINSAREAVVDNNALAEALKTKKLGGAAVDLDYHSRTELPNAITTPHTAWRSEESREKGMEIFVGNLVAWRNGRPRNLIS